MAKVQANKDAVLNILKGTTFTAPANAYVGLFKTNPSDDNMSGVVESNYTNYARITLGTLSSAWSAISGTSPRQISNANVVNFATAGGTGDTVNGFCITNHLTNAFSTAGLYWNALTGAPKTINPNDPVSIAVGALVVTEA